jgi:hypothetical protein
MLLRSKQRILIARLLVGFVVTINLQCALVFIINPEGFAPLYELFGIPGKAAIQAFGVLFIMWNIPYAVALVNPVKFHISHYEAIIMQTIGLVGESLIYYDLPTNYIMLRNSILRFIIFDGAGLVALALAAWITYPVVNSKKQPSLDRNKLNLNQ